LPPHLVRVAARGHRKIDVRGCAACRRNKEQHDCPHPLTLLRNRKLVCSVDDKGHRS
jgi:hypothetical protein